VLADPFENSNPQEFSKKTTIQYDTRCYFNVRSKADTSQLNLPQKLKSKKKRICSEVAYL